LTHPSRLILASASPRRRQLLTQIGIRFDVHAADIDETRHPNEGPAAYVQRLALSKAVAVHALHPDDTILGADTTVVVDNHILEKPTDRADAERMLRMLAGGTHQVLTAIAVVTSSEQRTHVEATNVFFAEIPQAELDHYIASGDPFDKAGAYGIQGYAARWITRVEGDFFNVMGLPLAATVRLLNNL
jgi:septum formation protein